MNSRIVFALALVSLSVLAGAASVSIGGSAVDESKAVAQTFADRIIGYAQIPEDRVGISAFVEDESGRVIRGAQDAEPFSGDKDKWAKITVTRESGDPSKLLLRVKGDAQYESIGEISFGTRKSEAPDSLKRIVAVSFGPTAGGKTEGAELGTDLTIVVELAGEPEDKSKKISFSTEFIGDSAETLIPDPNKEILRKEHRDAKIYRNYATLAWRTRDSAGFQAKKADFDRTSYANTRLVVKAWEGEPYNSKLLGRVEKSFELYSAGKRFGGSKKLDNGKIVLASNKPLSLRFAGRNYELKLAKHIKSFIGIGTSERGTGFAQQSIEIKSDGKGLSCSPLVVKFRSKETCEVNGQKLIALKHVATLVCEGEEGLLLLEKSCKYAEDLYEIS